MQGFSGISKAIVVVNQGIELVNKACQFLGKGITIADTMTQTTARLSLINDGLQTTEELQNKIFQSAQCSRGAYSETASVVAKLGILAKDAFSGNDEAIYFAEQMNKSFKVGGASIQEQSAGMYQLTQAMASGKLQGDEFRSIMENAPLLAQSIAEYTGQSMGELKQMSADGEITASVIKNAMFMAADETNRAFAEIPATFGEMVQGLGNKALFAFDPLIQRFSAWLGSDLGQQFFTNLASGVAVFADMATRAFDVVSNIYNVFASNWTTIEPIVSGIAAAIGILTAAFIIYNGVAFAVAAAESIKGAAHMLATGATIAETAAQWGLNAAMLACPAVWIVIAIIAVVAAIVGLVVFINKLWATNIDFKVGVIGIWNSILGFFDRIPVFFMGIGNGIADKFSFAKVMVLSILQSMANGAIDIINWLIEKLNCIPGVSINAIEHVTFGAEAAAEELAKIQERQGKYDAAVKAADDKSAAREAKLAEDKVKWQADIDAKTPKADSAPADKQSEIAAINPTPWEGGGASKPVDANVTGGGLDKAVDISSTSLQYLNEVAERTALQPFETLSAQMEVVADDSAKLSDEDKDILLSAAGRGTNIYYLQYDGSVNMSTKVQQGEDWESIKKRAREETQAQIEVGLSGVDEVVLS